MKIPLQVTFRHMRPSEALEADIGEKVSKLERFYDRITGCHVMIEEPHRHHHQGKLFHVRIELTVPGGELFVGRDPGLHHAHEDPFVAVRDAFDALRRQLQNYVQCQEHKVKAHEPIPSAHVSKLFPDEGYGFLETEDGREVYFHQNSVLNGGFRQLEIGSKVHFTEEMGDKGPQASSVRKGA